MKPGHTGIFYILVSIHALVTRGHVGLNAGTMLCGVTVCARPRVEMTKILKLKCRKYSFSLIKLGQLQDIIYVEARQYQNNAYQENYIFLYERMFYK